MCRGPIPRQVVTHLQAIFTAENQGEPAHLGRTCPHSERQFNGREFVPDEDEDSMWPTSFDHEFALPYSSLEWMNLCCPGFRADITNGFVRKVHTDEYVLTIGTVMRGDNIVATDRQPLKHCYGVWHGPQQASDENISIAHNLIGLPKAKGENGAILEAASKAISSHLFCLRRGKKATGGRLIIKTKSSYFYQGFAEYLDVWKVNGYKNLQGRAVRHKDMWETIEREVQELQTQFRTSVHVREVDDEHIKPLVTLLKNVKIGDFQGSQAEPAGTPNDAAAAGRREWKTARDRHFRKTGLLTLPQWYLLQYAQQAREWSPDDVVPI
jgi:hypothetical protein